MARAKDIWMSFQQELWRYSLWLKGASWQNWIRTSYNHTGNKGELCMQDSQPELYKLLQKEKTSCVFSRHLFRFWEGKQKRLTVCRIVFFSLSVLDFYCRVFFFFFFILSSKYCCTFTWSENILVSIKMVPIWNVTCISSLPFYNLWLEYHFLLSHAFPISYCFSERKTAWHPA